MVEALTYGSGWGGWWLVGGAAKEGSSRSGDVVLAYGAPSRYIGTGDHR